MPNTGRESYERYTASLAKQGCECDEWEFIEAMDKEAWQAVADECDKYKARCTELEIVLNSIAFSSRTKTGMKELARDALFYAAGGKDGKIET